MASPAFGIALQLIEDAETNGSKEAGYKFLMATSAGNQELATLQASFEAKLDELEQALAKLPWSRVGGKKNFDLFAAAVGAIALAYVRNRICTPRDMSAGAAIAFR